MAIGARRSSAVRRHPGRTGHADAPSREQRIAYLLGDLLRITHTEYARICEISPATFRQWLARARTVMRQLMGQRRGLARASNPRRCDKLVGASMDAGGDPGLVDLNARSRSRIGETAIRALPRVTETIVVLRHRSEPDPPSHRGDARLRHRRPQHLGHHRPHRHPVAPDSFLRVEENVTPRSAVQVGSLPKLLLVGS
jgi:hypothetical protein